MAQFTKVSGTTQPVFAIDVGNGSIAGTANVAANGSVQMAGPKLDFFTVTANTNLATSTGAGNATGYINNVLQAIQQTTTIAMYQVEPVSPWQSIAMAVYPNGAANTTTIVTAAQQANATGGLNIGIPTANVSATAKFFT
jgi:hypothetical protein